MTDRHGVKYAPKTAGTDPIATDASVNFGNADAEVLTIDRLTDNAYDLLVEGESYRQRLKPRVLQ